jgi:hydroxyacylglutathione hydrolase
MFVRRIEDDQLAQVSYLIGCQRTGEAIVIDPERDIDRYIDLAKQQGLTIVAATETHIHADFISGLREFGEHNDTLLLISGEGGADWTPGWLDQHSSGSSYNHRLIMDGETFSIGNIEFKVVHTPGHTPEHISFLVTDHGGGADSPMAILSGDFLFVGDLGRPDLLESAAGQMGSMEPSAKKLFQSIQLIDGLAEHLQVWPGHGAGSACGKALGAVPTSTIGYERRFNGALSFSDDEGRFVEEILSGQPEPPLYFANMKRLNRDGAAVLGALPTPQEMDGDQFVASYQEGVRVMDTRQWKRFQQAHLPGAWSIPMTSRLGSYLGSFGDAEAPYIIVGEEAEIEEVVRRMIRIGFDRIVGWFPSDKMESCRRFDGSWLQVEEVAADQVHSVVHRDDVKVLDLRRATEYQEEHISGALNLSHTRLALHLDELDKDTTWHLMCETGDRSERTASFLASRGYSVINLAGGMQNVRSGKVVR